MSSSLHDRPSAAELLEAIAATLEERVLPEVDGGVRHDVRVAANLCRVIAREVGSDEVSNEAINALQSLVGDDALEGAALLTEATRLIDDGAFDGDSERAARAAALAHVKAKLAVTRPGYDSAS